MELLLLLILPCLVIGVSGFFIGYFYHAQRLPKFLAGMTEYERKSLAAKVAEERTKR